MFFETKSMLIGICLDSNVHQVSSKERLRINCGSMEYAYNSCHESDKTNLIPLPGGNMRILECLQRLCVFLASAVLGYFLYNETLLPGVRRFLSLL